MTTKSKGKLIAAMSGGVDSSVAAAHYVKLGYEVIGVTLKMKACDDTKEKTKSCCGVDDNIQARLVASKLGISHYFLDVRPEFKEKVLSYTWNEYAIARTPNPCVRCNHFLKFGALLEYADKVGADGVITGHYANLERGEDGNNRLIRGKDDIKNQTYFLCMLTQDQLNRSYMPLGQYSKPEVREMARELGLTNAEKQESQDACFGYKGETFATTLSRYFDQTMPEGDIITEDGKVVGHHKGIHHFTIGQRKGHGVALGKPAYVVKIDAETNTVEVSTDSSLLMETKLEGIKMNWLQVPGNEFRCKAQIRYNQRPMDATVIRVGDTQAIIEFDEPVRAITSGQALTLYDNDVVLAGGWIK